MAWHIGPRDVIMAAITVYISIGALLLALFLFGPSPAFKGTWINAAYLRVQQCLTSSSGAKSQLDSMLHLVLGARAPAVKRWLSQTRTPLAQITYLFLLLSSFVLYAHYLLLPMYQGQLTIKGLGPATPYVAVTALLATLVAYYCLCCSDPGTITQENVEHYHKLYALDGCIWQEKDCYTCNFKRPARSKHCPSCRRCVARFDHHCLWMNGCVGLANMRYFLLFLACNIGLCCYGIYGGVQYLMTKLDASHPAMKVALAPSTGLLTSIAAFSQAAFALEPGMAQCLLLTLVFLGVLLTFIGQYIYLVARNQTSYELLKAQQLQAQARAEEAKRNTGAQAQPTKNATIGADATSEGADEVRQEDDMNKSAKASEPSAGATTQPRTPDTSFYSKGIVGNVMEVLWPCLPKTNRRILHDS